MLALQRAAETGIRFVSRGRLTAGECYNGGAAVGGLAQLGERVNGIHEVRGSTPLSSTGTGLTEAIEAVSFESRASHRESGDDWRRVFLPPVLTAWGVCLTVGQTRLLGGLVPQHLTSSRRG